MANGIDFGTAIGLIKGLGSPDPAVIEGAVNGWLDDHPEATTTVQDGSITKAKLDSNLQGTIDDVADLKSHVGLIEDTIDLVFDDKTGRIYVTINGVKKGNGVQIAEPGDIDVSSIVSWYRSQVQYAYNYVSSLPENTVSHIMVTDLHYDTNYRHSAAICNLLMDTGKFDKLWIMGDLTDDNTDAQYQNFLADGWANNNGNIIFALGNHDVRTPSGGYPTYQDFYDDFLSDAEYATGASSTLYYTYIDTARHIKYVVLNTETITSDQNDPQLTMIRTAVADAGWDVFVLAHRNIAFGMNLAQELGSAVTEAITTAIESGAANIIGYLCGHQHIDVVTNIDNAFYLSTWLCDRHETTNYYPGYSVTTRNDGTWSAQAITIISIDNANRSVKFMRIGAAYSTGVWEYRYAKNGGTLPTRSGHTVTLYTDEALPDGTTVNVADGIAFSVELTPNTGASFGAIVVTMGDTDITSTSVTGNVVSIASVTDDVIIRAMAVPANSELINFYKTAGGALTSFDEASGAFTFTSGTRDFNINALNAGDVVHVKCNSLSNWSGYISTDQFKYGYAGTETNVIYAGKNIDRDLLISSDGTLILHALASGDVSVKKTVADTGELFTPELSGHIIGDATYEFNQDGSVTIGGTPDGTNETNCVKFVIPVIAGADYDLRISSAGSGYAIFSVLSDDTNANGQYTQMGGSALWSPSNYSYTTINNKTKLYSNTTQTGRGKMVVRLNPATTYTISVKLH